MKIIGKMYMNAICPLCDCVYALENHEFNFTDIKVEDSYFDQDYNFHPPIYKERVTFLCPECNRRVNAKNYRYQTYTDDYVNMLNNEMKKK